MTPKIGDKIRLLFARDLFAVGVCKYIDKYCVMVIVEATNKFYGCTQIQSDGDGFYTRSWSHCRAV